jgi:CheY-like chemotaxis protein
LLDELHRAGAAFDERLPKWFNVLVVDDEEVARRAVDFALEKVKVKPIIARDSMGALKVAGERRLDLIISDIEMPGVSGLALCEKIRANPVNATTPLMFVTSITDFANRAQAVLKGGNDLIAKPFLFSELGLKVLVFLFKPYVAG